MKDLLLLHGAVGSADQLFSLKEKLASRYRIHVPEFPGHGQTVSEEAFSIELFVSYLVDYCKTEKLERVSIFGYSMGGYVALTLALQHPELIEKIITLATK